MGRDLGAQLRGPEGLADVVVRAQPVAGDGVLLGNPRGEEEDGAVKGGAYASPGIMTSQSTRSKRERSIPGTAVGSVALTTSWPSRPRTRASASRIARSSSTASILAMFDLLKFSSELY